MTWIDAAGGKTGWLERGEAEKYEAYKVESYGWLVKRTKTHVTLALSRCERASGRVQFADTLDVPHGMVRSIKRVR